MKIFLLTILTLSIMNTVVFAQPITRVCDYPMECKVAHWKCPPPAKKWFNNMTDFLTWAKANPDIEYKIGYWPIDDTKTRQIIYYPLGCVADKTICHDDDGECLR